MCAVLTREKIDVIKRRKIGFNLISLEGNVSDEDIGSTNCYDG